MLKEFKTGQDKAVTIEISKEGEVSYTAGKKTVTFNINDCRNFTYYYNDGTESVVDNAALMNADSSEIDDTKLWQIVLKGEELLERNNEHTETRRHESYDSKNDKWETVIDRSVDIEEEVFSKIRDNVLHEAISKLLPQQQELVQKVFFEKKTMVDIARENGVSAKAIQERVNKIKNQLKKIIINKLL